MGKIELLSLHKALFISSIFISFVFTNEISANGEHNANSNNSCHTILSLSEDLNMADQVCGERHSPIRIFRKRGDRKLGIFEFGIMGGTSHSFSDIQRNKGLGIIESITGLFENTGYSAGLYVNYRHVDHFGLGAGVNVIGLSGYGFAENIGFINAGDVVSGFSFENQIYEANGRLMFYAPISSQRVFDLYAFFGLSVFYNMLELRDQNQLVTFPTEEYNKVQMALPFGVGFSVRIAKSFTVGLESGYRYTPFNYLDGVNIPDSRYDAFFLNQFKVGFFFN
jgi:hypothetical protein